MDQSVWDALFEDIRTQDEAYQLDDELRTIQQQSYTIVGKANVAVQHLSLAERARSVVSYKTYQKIRALEEKHALSESDPDQLRLFFEMAHRKINELPRLQIQVAIAINDEIVDSLYTWVKLNIRQKVLLDIIVKPQILAGCVIVYQGIYRDYSLRSVFDNNAKGIFQPILASIEQRSAPKK